MRNTLHFTTIFCHPFLLRPLLKLSTGLARLTNRLTQALIPVPPLTPYVTWGKFLVPSPGVLIWEQNGEIQLIASSCAIAGIY